MTSGVSITCANPACGRTFLKARGEYNRRRRLGQEHFFCTQSCQVVRSGGRGNGKWLIPGNRLDDLTPFRWFVLRARQRKHKGPTDLTPEYLKEIWDNQKGVCPFTGWSLLLPDSTNGWKAGPDPKNASLDRIDNDLGYVRGNVRFISVMGNTARGQFSDEELRAFCQAVASEVANG